MFARRSIRLKKLVKEAGHWLRLSEKISAYRRDVLKAEELENLQRAATELEKASKRKASEAIQEAIDKLEKILGKYGGCFYPRSGWAENVEMFLVAAILAIGIRTFFIQPFKIPTNSMYPTYHGMTYHVYQFEAGEKRPNWIKRAVRKTLLWASYEEIRAPVEGELVIPISAETKTNEYKRYSFQYEKVKGRKFFLFPTRLKKYTLYIGDYAVQVQVPQDFTFEKVIRDRFVPEGSSIIDWLKGKVDESDERGPVIKTGLTFKKGDTLLAFDILTGDALFVDRVSYHFVRPKVGHPIVFRTRNIAGITQHNRGIPDDKYYIKRLVGQGGDILEVKHPLLLRNGKPIEGAEAFLKNAAEQKGEYDGYTNISRLASGLKDLIPKKSFYAMGDNSDESFDSRFWGSLPEKEVIGKALFIYYPLSHRWGPAE